jgi:hypothetical protein
MVQFSAAKAANSSQTDVVVFHVLSANSTAVSVAPTGLIFVAPAGGTNPQPQTVTVTNASNQALNLTATAVAPQNGLFSVNPASATVSASSPAQFTITANIAGLAPGAYPGFLEVNFGGNSTEHTTAPDAAVYCFEFATPAADAAPWDRSQSAAWPAW